MKKYALLLVCIFYSTHINAMNNNQNTFTIPKEGLLLPTDYDEKHQESKSYREQNRTLKNVNQELETKFTDLQKKHDRVLMDKNWWKNFGIGGWIVAGIAAAIIAYSTYVDAKNSPNDNNDWHIGISGDL